jgi:hypothetical protein
LAVFRIDSESGDFFLLTHAAMAADVRRLTFAAKV